LRKISYQSGIHKEPKYFIRLTEEERAQLTEVVNKGQTAAYKIKHANVLLKVDANGQDWNDVQTAAAFSCAPRTVSSLHNALSNKGLKPHWSARNRLAPRGNRFRMSGKKRISSSWLVVNPQPGVRGRHCGCWPQSWRLWRWWRPSPQQPSCAPSKQPTQAASAYLLGDSTRAKR